MGAFEVDELGRRKNIVIWTVFIVVFLIIAIIFTMIYFNKKEVHYVHCEEEGIVDYKVYLNDNEYFNSNMIGKNNQYIASLINYISAEFKYNLKLEESLKYNYKYNIIADINVIDDDTNKSIYSYSDNIIDEFSGETIETLNIDKEVKIDYQKYNNKIKEFVNVYNLSNTTSKLTLRMNIDIEGDNQSFNNIESVIAIDIPLTTNTIAIDVNTDLLSNTNSNKIALIPSNKNIKVWRNLSIITFIIDLLIIIFFIKYYKESETEKDRYNVQMRKILNNYGSYISKIEDEFDMKEYQILKVTNFIDLLEIRDTLQIPIIMIENKEQFVTCFIIPANNKILYFYSLGITQYVLPQAEESKEENSEQKI